jgi:nucleotide-binding universal stress UspA family protein
MAAMKMLASPRQTKRAKIAQKSTAAPGQPALQPLGTVFKRILVPVDFSAPSYRALSFAAQLARPCGAFLTLVHIVEPILFPTDWVYPLPTDFTAEQRKDILASMQKMIAKHGLQGRPVLRDGQVWHEIVNVAKQEKCDLIVMATHGYTGMRRALLGSVAARVIQHAPCPVLSVRGGNLPAGARRGAARVKGRAPAPARETRPGRARASAIR